jgi:hypothetical protein
VIFDGGEPNPDSVLTKAKSDYVTKSMTEQGILTLLNGLVKAPGEIAVLCEPINKVAADATAFVHRANTKYVMQYYMQWDSAGATNANIAMMLTLYTSMGPFVSSGCYVNYCDLDLGAGYAKAYWDDNLPKLMKIKGEVDPKNIFIELKRFREKRSKQKAGKRVAFTSELTH